MYPDLSYVIYDLFGVGPDNFFSIFKMFGLVMILAFIASAYFLRKELIRKEREGLLKSSKEKVKVGFPATTTDLILNALFGFILGFKGPYVYQQFDAFKEDPAAILLSGQGNLLAGLVLAAVFAGLKYWDSNRRKLAKPIIKEVEIKPHQRIADITILAAVSGIIGAKLFAVIESTENFKAFLSDPLGQLLSGSGLAIYGGLIVAFIAVYWYVGKKGMKPIHVMDAVAPALIIGYGVGRIGCQLSGDGDWGIVNTLAQPNWWFLPDWMWAYDYPRNVLERGVEMTEYSFKYRYRLGSPVYPTPIYEAILSFGIAGILWGLRKRIKIPGVIFFIYMILNGVERYWIEKIRINPDIEIFGMNATQAEYIAILLVAGGLLGIFLVWRKHQSVSKIPGKT